MSTEYTVSGRVTHRDGTPALDVTVLAIDVDVGADDPLSGLTRRTDPDATRNFRTPGLDLDSVYGLGPEASPYLYESVSDRWEAQPVDGVQQWEYAVL